MAIEEDVIEDGVQNIPLCAQVHVRSLYFVHSFRYWYLMCFAGDILVHPIATHIVLTLALCFHAGDSRRQLLWCNNALM